MDTRPPFFEGRVQRVLGSGRLALDIEGGSCIGIYTRRRGLKRTYRYRATWKLAGNDVLWEATVSLDGKARGAPSGVIGRSPQPEQAVREMLEAAIEALIGIDE